MELRPRVAALAYARRMAIGATIALVMIVVELIAYVSGVLSPYVPLRDLPGLWGMPMKEYLAAAKVPVGWGWLELAGKGDYVNFIGIALLASIPIACYIGALRHFLATRERAYAALAAAQIFVILAAASGLLNSIFGGSP